ncbi:MAG: molecular chaperone Skp [Paracoccus denitrificans]|nr:MAG: molecular chaperone Skp [Paracoccus denitrificans]PZO84455.1 MAG: molecular chaperone Skp [Paracoccus denitrificans]
MWGTAKTAGAALLASLVLAAPPVLAQNPAPGLTPAPSPTQQSATIPMPSPNDPAVQQAIVTVDQEALFLRSKWGLRVQQELGSRSRTVAADNERIFNELSAEESALTDLRRTLSAEDFRKRAQAFDARVTSVRTEREIAARELTTLADAERQAFFRIVAPLIGQEMRGRGALVALDPRTILFSSESIDVTAQVISMVDAQAGDGAGQVSVDQVAAAARAEVMAMQNGDAATEAAPGGPPLPDGAGTPGNMDDPSANAPPADGSVSDPPPLVPPGG